MTPDPNPHRRPADPAAEPIEVDELAQAIAVQLACLTRLLPLRGKHGTPRDKLDEARMRLSWEFASRLLRGLEMRRRPPLEPHGGSFPGWRLREADCDLDRLHPEDAERIVPRLRRARVQIWRLGCWPSRTDDREGSASRR